MVIVICDKWKNLVNHLPIIPMGTPILCKRDKQVTRSEEVSAISISSEENRSNQRLPLKYIYL